MRKIAVVSVSRSDYGLLRPLLLALQQHPGCQLQLVVAGMHLDPSFGDSLQEIVKDQIKISAKVPLSAKGDQGQDAAKAFGLGVAALGQELGALHPDLLVLLGDRYEMFAAATAAVFLGIPLAHIHGGELTLGAIDDVFRHSMTKMAHLHFVSTQQYADRVAQLGEERWRITVSGAPGLDNLRQVQLLSAESLEKRFGLCLAEKPLLVTFHPVTTEPQAVVIQGHTLLAALLRSGHPAIVTAPNADPGGRALREIFRDAAHRNPRIQLIDNLGTEGYFSLMNLALAMVGNSSSGIIEAASFSLPVVDIGNRQEGRIRPDNVLHCSCEEEAILDAIKQATSKSFRQAIRGMSNPYGDGRATDRILEVLLTVPLEKLPKKQFVDMAGGGNHSGGAGAAE